MHNDTSQSTAPDEGQAHLTNMHLVAKSDKFPYSLCCWPSVCTAKSLPSKTACLNDFFWRHCWSEVRSIVKHKAATLVSRSTGGIYTGLHYIFLPALDWMILCRFLFCLQARQFQVPETAGVQVELPTNSPATAKLASYSYSD